MLVGYMRVSTDGDRQVLDLQRDALLAAAVFSSTTNMPAAWGCLLAEQAGRTLSVAMLA